MKKKLIKMFALMLCLVFMLSCTVFAAGSPDSNDVVGSGSPSSGDVVDDNDKPSTDNPSTDNPSTDVPSIETPGTETPSTDSGSASTTDESQKPAVSYAEGVTAAKVTFNGVELEVTVKAVTNAVVSTAAEQAKTMVGETAAVLKVFDVSLPEGDYSVGVDVTMNVPGVVAGQNVSVLHQKADGTWESLKVVKVENGSVTATFTSFSPVAIVSNATAPGTGSETPVALMLVVALAVVAAGAGIVRGAKLKTE